MVKRKNVQDISGEIPIYLDPIYRPPTKPTEISLQESPRKLMDLDTDINTDLKEKFSYQEGIISETYQRPNRSYFQEPPTLDCVINTGKLVQKFLPQQDDIDKILKKNSKKSS